MAHPENSVPMLGMEGPFGYIDMGGMFTLLKVREGLKSYEDPGGIAIRPEPSGLGHFRRKRLARDGIELGGRRGGLSRRRLPAA